MACQGLKERKLSELITELITRSQDTTIHNAVFGLGVRNSESMFYAKQSAIMQGSLCLIKEALESGVPIEGIDITYTR